MARVPPTTPTVVLLSLEPIDVGATIGWMVSATLVLIAALFCLAFLIGLGAWLLGYTSPPDESTEPDEP